MGRFFMIKNDAMIVFLRLDFLSVNWHCVSTYSDNNGQIFYDKK